MDTRRLPLLLLLVVLLAVPAQASDHTMECFTGLTPEKEQAVAGRLSCGWVVGNSREVKDDSNQAPSSSQGDVKKVMRSSWFFFGELAEYVAGRDSGEALDGWMLGARYSMLAQNVVEPFIHVMGGKVRPSRPIDVPDDDAATDWTGAGLVGFGIDIKTTRSIPNEEPPAVVPVIRLQIDGVDTGVNDPYLRVTVGVAFRFKGRAHK